MGGLMLEHSNLVKFPGLLNTKARVVFRGHAVHHVPLNCRPGS